MLAVIIQNLFCDVCKLLFIFLELINELWTNLLSDYFLMYESLFYFFCKLSNRCFDWHASFELYANLTGY